MAQQGSDPKESPLQEKERLRALAEHNVNSLSSEFAIAQEWGLFTITDATEEKGSPAKIILASLRDAQAALAVNDFATVDTSLLAGRAALNQAQFNRPIWYIGNNRFGLLPMVFTACSAAFAYWIVFICFLGLSVADTIHHPAFLGLAGAVLKSLYWLQYQINKGLLRPRWFAYFIVAPFVGLLLGALSSLIVKVGFKLASGGGTTVPDWRTVGLVATFAGFNWEWALEKFRAGAEAVTSRLRDKKKNSSSGGK